MAMLGPTVLKMRAMSDLDLVLAVVAQASVFGHPLALVVATADTVGVHVAPVVLALRVDLGVAVDLRRLASSMRAQTRLARPSMWYVPSTLVLNRP